MPVRVARGLKTRIRADPGGIVVQVRQSSDPEAAAEALSRAAEEVAALDGGWKSAPGLAAGDTNGPTFVSAVTRTPSGPFVVVDGGHTPSSLLSTIPDIVVRHLENAGVREAVVGWPREQSPITRSNHMGIYGLGPAAILHAFPPPRRTVDPGHRVRLPQSWPGTASGWLTEGLASGEEVWAELNGIAFSLLAGEVAGFVESCRARAAGHLLLTAGTPERLRASMARFSSDEWLSLGGGGPAMSPADLQMEFDDLVAIGRTLAGGAAYVLATIEETFNRISPNASSEWPRVRKLGGGLMQRLCDEIVDDAFPWQVLGPGHIARLTAGGRSEVPGAVPLPGSRVELRIGDLSNWLPSSVDRTAIQSEGRQLLSPCLLNKAQARELFNLRLRASPPGDDGKFGQR